MKKLGLILFAATALAGCDADGERTEDPETLNERRAAYRQACVAEALATQSADDIATIEDVLANIDTTNPLAEVNRMASTAALEFARAYEAHASLRESAYAYMDSAANHSRTTADSARFLDRASSFTIRSPRPGSVEENVIVSYQADFTAMLQNGDHPCNWDLPF